MSELRRGSCDSSERQYHPWHECACDEVQVLGDHREPEEYWQRRDEVVGKQELESATVAQASLTRTRATKRTTSQATDLSKYLGTTVVRVSGQGTRIMVQAAARRETQAATGTGTRATAQEAAETAEAETQAVSHAAGTAMAQIATRAMSRMPIRTAARARAGGRGAQVETRLDRVKPPTMPVEPARMKCPARNSKSFPKNED